MTSTRLAEQARRESLTITERVTAKPFRVVVDIDPTVYDDPDFTLQVHLETIDDATGSTRGAISTHAGTPRGKSQQWALGFRAPISGLKTVIRIVPSRSCVFGLTLEEDDTNSHLDWGLSIARSRSTNSTTLRRRVVQRRSR